MTCPAEAAERGFGTLIFGVGTEALAVIILLVMFRRRGWLGKGS